MTTTRTTKSAAFERALATDPTAEVAISAISATDARRITEQIKVSVEAVWHLISQAYTTRTWSALGYASWDEYCTREFGTSRLRLPREERSEVVASLRDSGLSLRAIAAATGDSKSTIGDDAAGVQERTPEPDVDAEPAQPITGTDGKTYQRPEPKRHLSPVPDADEFPAKATKHRRPLDESFWQAAYDLTKVTERIERLVEDDRFPQNAEKVATKHRSDLTRAIDALQGVVNRLSPA